MTKIAFIHVHFDPDSEVASIERTHAYESEDGITKMDVCRDVLAIMEAEYEKAKAQFNDEMKSIQKRQESQS